MARIGIAEFDGIVPRRSPTLLADNQAQVADNAKLYSGELRFWRGETEVASPGLPNLTTIYRLYQDGVPIWLTWDKRVDVAASPVADVGDRRIYYTGDDFPKKTNYALASASSPYPDSFYALGVPAPNSAPTASTPVANNDVDATNLFLRIEDAVSVGDTGDIDADGNFTYAADDPVSTTINPGGASPSLTLEINDTVVTTSEGSMAQSPNNVVHRDLPITGSVSPPSYTSTDVPDLETRVYVYTFISEFGTVLEESAPSPPSNLVDVRTQEVTITDFEDAPTGDYNIVAIRIYRSVAGATTNSFQFVAELPIAETSFEDTLPTAELGEVLQTEGWTTPPNGLEGIVAMPNGILAGFEGNSVYFSEPYYPHAWPYAYAVSLPYDIVGLGVVGQSVVACTTVSPFVISGINPGAMSQEEIPIQEPCVSKESITSDKFGVMYASPNGLVNIAPGEGDTVTNALYRRDEWQMLDLDSMVSFTYDGKYFGFFNDPTEKAVVVSRDDIPALSRLELNAVGAFLDERTAKLFVIDASSNAIEEMDSADLQPLTYTWRSKRFRMTRAHTYSVLRLDADYDQLTIDDQYNAELSELYEYNEAQFGSDLMGAVNTRPLNTFDVNGSTMLNLPALATARTAQVLIYGDNQELVASMFPTSLDPIILPPFKAREIEIEIVGNIDVFSVEIASNIEELQA